MFKFEIKEPEIDNFFIVEVGLKDSEKYKNMLDQSLNSYAKMQELKNKYKNALEILLNDLIILSADGQPIFGNFEEMNTNVKGFKINEGIAALVERAKMDIDI